MTAVPPVPEQPEERGVNIIKLEEPEELNVMPTIKRTRAQERDDEMKSDNSKEPKKGKKKVKENEAESSKKKKSRRPRRVIGIDDFPLDEKSKSDESSYGDEESYTSEESSMEVMGLVFQQPQAKGSSTSKEVEVVADRTLHCQRVEEGLQRLYQYGGQLNPDKCHVAEKEVVLLGHVISQEGIKVDPSRVQAILDLLPPNSARQVITFVQKVRYMSCVIHLLSQIISPLQQLANQEVFSWEQEHWDCFNEVKEVLGSLPTIMPPDPQGNYYLCPSVGLDAFGAVLMQKDPKTVYMQPIYFTSKVMTQGQKGYTDIEQLVFSLIVAIRKFRSYLLPKPFIIFTLEHNLPYAIQHMSISSKISKWVLELQEYEYTFIVEDNTRASLADVLTYKVKEKKITPKSQGKLDLSSQGELEDGYTLLFDGAYRRQRNKATGGFFNLNEEKKEVLKKGIQLHLAHSNNEAEYATLKAGLEECKSMGIKRLMVNGDALLIVKQLQEYEYTFIVEDSTRASLVDVLTYKVKEKKITPKAQGKLDLSPQGKLEDGYTLLFDGAYRRQRNKATGGFFNLNEEKNEVLKKGIQLHLAHSNNEAEYATLKAGLEECKSMGIKRLMVNGDALLIVRQVQGTWACKNSKLLQWLHEVKLLMKDFEAIQIQHISHQHNKEADNMANT
ncbi:hypothetical protein L7F22_053529 [Adiantum nelumboides]|nr:hypothetical protein [Adiantum nelumboides]